ncbi:MAG TPA: sulfatase [Mycobacteriales bacterium]|nr:sulfatase [Mycobacteriales bacterium]
MTANRPNIVYLHTHDTGRYVGAYGAPVSTPRIDQLATEGMLFHQAFSAAPTCSPSRAALLTGELPHNTGMLGLAHRGFRLTDPQRHLASFLKSLGYRTATAGVEHVSSRDEIASLGFTDQLRAAGRAAEIAASAADFVTEQDDAPFFLSVGFTETHTAPSSPDGLFGYPPVNTPTAPAPTLPSTPDIRADMASFAAAAAAADAGFGAVLDALDRAGLAENTLVILTTDHGIAMPGMKGTLSDAGTGVMLILRGPGGFTGGVSTDAMVSHLDLYPTIAELLGVERPEWLQGVSLLPLTQDPNATVRSDVVAEVTYHASYEPKRTIRGERYRYVRRFGERDRPVLPNTDDSAGKRLWLQNGWAERSVAAEALYDTLFDPHEMVNLAGDPALESILSELRDRLFASMRETSDPLLDGDVPPADPALVTDPDQVGPALGGKRATAP